MSYSLSLVGSSLSIVDIDNQNCDYNFPLLATAIKWDELAQAVEFICANQRIYFTWQNVSSPTIANYAALKTLVLGYLNSATLKVDNIEISDVTIDGSTLAKDASLVSILNKIIAAPATEGKQDALNVLATSIIAQLVTNQNIGGKTESLNAAVAPVVTAASGYVAGNAIGTKLQFVNILGAKKTGVLHSILITDRTAVAKLPLEIIIFNADLAGAVVNKIAYAMDSADVSKVIRRISISASDYIIVGGVAIVDIRGIGGVLKSTTQDLWVVCVATGAGSGNFTNTSDFNVRLSVLQD